jgi:alpha-L-fucosidase
MLTDIVAKGGNLLLNVGPRGVDAQIPDEQLTRLDWLAQWVVPNAPAIATTRPWVRPGTNNADGHDVRYTARDDLVFAIVRDAPASVVLPDVRATPTSAVTTVTGDALAWKDTPAGISVDIPAEAVGRAEPAVIRLQAVAAR